MSVQVAVGFVLVFLVYWSSPNLDNGDGFSALPTAHSLVYERDLDLGEFEDAWWYDDHYGIVDVDDRRVTYFPWLSAVFAAPAVVLWDGLSAFGLVENSVVAIEAGRVGRLHLLPASACTAAAAVVLGLLTRRLFELRRESDPAPAEARVDPLGPWSLTAWIVLAGLTTSLWSVASRSMGQHGPSVLLGGAAMLVLTGLLGRTPSRHPGRAAAALGALLALAYWQRPTNVVLTAVALAVLALRRRELAGHVLVGTAATHAVMLSANLLLVGRAVPPYFAGGRVGWHDELVDAAAANLVSPARGLLVFSPFLIGAALLAAPSRRANWSSDLSAYVLVAALGTAGYLVVASGFEESWWAGASYGPRFMTEALVLVAPVALLGWFADHERRSNLRGARLGIVSALLLWSAVAHGTGASISAVDCWNRARTTIPAPGVWDWDEPQVLEGSRLVLEHGWAGAKRVRCDVTDVEA